MSRASDLERRVREYWDLDAATSDHSPGHDPQTPVELAVWAATLRRLLPPPAARVLDAGAGTGFLSLLLAREGYRPAPAGRRSRGADWKRGPAAGWLYRHTPPAARCRPHPSTTAKGMRRDRAGRYACRWRTAGARGGCRERSAARWLRQRAQKRVARPPRTAGSWHRVRPAPARGMLPHEGVPQSAASSTKVLSTAVCPA